jgi:hypothetical protein
VPTSERVLVSNATPSWLPDGGRADVILGGTDSVPPSPTSLVRLLATRHGKVFTVHRADGSGLDIPSLSVEGGAVEGCLKALMVRTFGGVHPARFLGYVRNIVSGAPNDYAWPSPHAHFAVWHCALPPDCDPRGCGSISLKPSPS